MAEEIILQRVVQGLAPKVRGWVDSALSGGSFLEQKSAPYSGSKRGSRIQRVSRAKRPRRRPAKGVALKIDGTTAGTAVLPNKKKRRTKKKKKFNAKKEIAKVRRLIPKTSTKTFRDFKTIVLQAISPNEHTIYDITCFNKGDYDGYAADLTKVDTNTVADYTTSNTSLKMSQYYKLMMKNNMTSNAELSYAFFICKDDDNESPIQSIREELTDRGYIGLPTVTSLTGATATSSEKPLRLVNGAGTTPYHIPVFGGGALRRNWRMVGHVKSAVVGPGDTIDLVWARKNFTYKPEVLDQEASFSYISNYSVRLVISIKGSLGHDATNPDLVGRSGYQFDCEEQKQVMVRYSNPKGLHEVEYTDTLTNVNFTDPKHADNHASKVESDDRV